MCFVSAAERPAERYLVTSPRVWTGARVDTEVHQMLRTVTGALSAFGLALGVLGVVTVFVYAPLGFGLGIAGFVFSGGSVVQRDGTEATRNVAALGAVISTLTICVAFIRL